MKLDRNTRKTVWFNLLVIILCGSLLYILFFISLGWLTHHGESVIIPNVVGHSMKDAVADLEGMTFEVIVDSAYVPDQKPFTVLKQIPDSGSSVKKGRTVFITVNKAQPPTAPMPNLIGLSYRSAEMILKNNKLLLGDTTYRPDIAEGAVLEQLYKGAQVKAGDMIPQGSKINLVLGDGLGNTDFNVPDLIGMPYNEAMSVINGMNLQGSLILGTASDTVTIYKQSPQACNELGMPNHIKEGDIIDIWAKANPSPEELEGNRNNCKAVNKDGDKK